MLPTRRLFLYLTTLFLNGLGHISIMPVFEGIDETAQYSSASASRFTDTGTRLAGNYIFQRLGLRPLSVPGLLWFRKTPSALALARRLIYAAAFQLVAIWLQITLYTACAVKNGISLKFSEPLFCLSKTSLLIERADIVGWPRLALFGFGAGLTCAAWLALLS